MESGVRSGSSTKKCMSNNLSRTPPKRLNNPPQKTKRHQICYFSFMFVLMESRGAFRFFFAIYSFRKRLEPLGSISYFSWPKKRPGAQTVCRRRLGVWRLGGGDQGRRHCMHATEYAKFPKVLMWPSRVALSLTLYMLERKLEPKWSRMLLSEAHLARPMPA